MKIIVAPNAFKESMSSICAANAMKTGALAACPDCEVECVPVADGGDGLLHVVTEALTGEIIPTDVHGPRMEWITSNFGFVQEKQLGIVEMALASGIALLPKSLQDPTKTTTYGTGELIKAALDRGAERIVVGLGGSATCDGGIGMAAALGYMFFDEKGKELSPIGQSLQVIHHIDTNNVDSRLQNTTIEAVCDVSNPFHGPNGASFVYSPQKGAPPEQVKKLDAGLARLAEVIKNDLGIDIKELPGSGAAGGLGGGMIAFCGATLRKGVDLVIDIVGLRSKIKDADLVITGEGQIDYQTKFDKAPAGVARLAAEYNVPCIAICGSIGEGTEELYQIGFHAIFSLCKGPQSLESAMENGPEQLAYITGQIVRTLQIHEGCYNFYVKVQ